MATRHMRATKGSVDAIADESLRITRDFLQHLFHHDIEWCLNKVDKDIVWIGSKKGFYANTRESFAEFMDRGVRETKPSTITDEEYDLAICTERLCCVTGRFLVLTPPEGEQISAHWNRGTFVWHRAGKRYLLIHMHMSAPVDYVEEGESYPIVAGTETYRYMRSLRRLGSSRKSVSLYDTEGTVHWVHPSQIIYLEASRKRTIVHCMTKEIVVPAVIRDAVDMVGDKIMRVHRSYAVNRDHVVELKAGRLLLDDGTSIAIPAKRIADVRATLMG